MKKLLTIISLVFMGLIATSCYDDSALWDSVNDQEQRIKTLESQCKEMNDNIASLKALLDATSTGDPITSVTPVKEGETEIGYTITFASGETITIYHGKNGESGATPQVGAAAYEGVLYWTINGEWVLDEEGNKVPVNGKDGKTPQLKVEDGVWYVSYDGSTWEEVPVTAGEDDALFTSLSYDEDYVYIHLSSGDVITIARSTGLDLIFPNGNEFSFFKAEKFSIEYQIIGGNEYTQLAAMTGNGWQATVEAKDATTGYIHITSPTEAKEGEVVLLLSDGKEKTFIKTISFKEGTLNVANMVYEFDATGGTFDVNLSTDLSYYVWIDPEVDWITLPGDTKSEMREETVSFNVAENTTHQARGSWVYFINNQGWVINGVYVYQYGVPYDAWYLIGGFNNWTCADEAYKMPREEDWFVLKNFTTEDTPLKFNIGSWDDERTGYYISSDFLTLLGAYGDNMVVPAGTYDVYMDKNATRAYFMTPGKTPGDLVETKAFEAGDYWLAIGDELAVPIPLESSYGYLYTTTFNYTDAGIRTSFIENALTFTAVEGGFTIQDYYGRYLYQKGKYTSFNVSEELPESGYIWTVTYNTDGTVNIYNVDVNKFVRYSLTYTSFGSYAEEQDDRLVPYLLPATAPIKPEEPLGWSVIGSFTEWSEDIFFAEDSTGYLAIKNVSLTTDDEFKLRYNADWTVNIGAAEGENTVVFGEAKTLYENGANIKVPEATACDIYFDEANSQIIVVKAGEGLDAAEEVVEATVADFLAAAEDDTWYKLTGKIANLKNTTYGNFDLVDASGSVYVYGLTATQVEKNDKSFSTLDLEEGDIVTIIGKRSSYNGTAQVGGPAYYISHVAAPVEDDTETEETPSDTTAYQSNVEFTTVAQSYTDGVATVNGVENVATLKFGTSKKYGEAQITLPAGTTKVTYYAVAWKGYPSKLEFSVDGTVMGTQEVAANDGATGNAPYTLTVTDSDHYTFNLPSTLEAESVVTVKTIETGYRAIVFGVVAE